MHGPDRYVFPVGKLALRKIDALANLTGFNYQERVGLQLLAALSLLEQVVFVATPDLVVDERAKDASERLKALRDEFNKWEWKRLRWSRDIANRVKHIWERAPGQPKTIEWANLPTEERNKRVASAASATTMLIQAIRKLIPLLLQKNKAFAYAVSPKDAAAANRQLTAPKPPSAKQSVFTTAFPEGNALIDEVYEEVGEAWNGRSGIAIIARGSVVGVTAGSACLAAAVLRHDGSLVTPTFDPDTCPAGVTATTMIAPSPYISLEEHPLFIADSSLDTGDDKPFRYVIRVLREVGHKPATASKRGDGWSELAASERGPIVWAKVRPVGQNAVHSVTEEWYQTVDETLGAWLRLDFEVGTDHEDAFLSVAYGFAKEDGTPLCDPSAHYSNNEGPWPQSVGNFDLFHPVLRRGRFPDYRMFVPYESLWAALPEGNWKLQCFVYLFELDRTEFDPLGWPVAGVKLLARSAPRPWFLTRPPLSTLHEAAKWGEVKMVIDQVGLQANINGLDATGRTPLHIAASAGQKTAAEVLVHHGARTDLHDEDGLTPLHCAALNGHADVAELLLARGADVNAPGGGARIRLPDKDGLTPLHCAALNGYADVVELLLARGADVNAAGKSGATALHLAAGRGHTDVVRILIATAGVNINRKDKHNHAPVDIAAMAGWTDVVEVFLSEGAAAAPGFEEGRAALGASNGAAEKAPEG